ncbi:MAG: AbrB/MazE/SpoVT family DNA-binding domain-containing protein [Candidatus Geothermarchaeales archaeon]
MVYLSEATVKVDQKGRVVIPSNIRRQLNIKNIVKISVRGGEITLKPVEDPLRSLEKLIVKGTTDVEREIRRLRGAAKRELQKEV